MANDSSTGGYLTPDATPSPIEDGALDAAFQKAIVGITGLAGSMVRPRWQEKPPKQPEPSVDWCAFGVSSQIPDAGPHILHVGAGSGIDELRRHEEIDVIATFYGPLCKSFAARLRDGLGLPQNIEELKASGIALIDAGTIRSVPELVNQQWIRRADITLRFRRAVTRSYAIRNILAADVHLFDDTGHLDEFVQVP